MIETPAPGEAPGDYAALPARLARSLLRRFAPAPRGWAALAEALGQGADPAPAGFEAELPRFLAEEIRFVVERLDLAAAEAELHLSPLPMFPVMRMTPRDGAEIAFPAPVAVLLTLAGRGPVAPRETLAETLRTALGPYPAAGSAAASRRRAVIETACAHDLGDGEAALSVTLPISLATATMAEAS
jgi:hypothetical protein